IDENNIHSNIDWLGENLRQFGLTYAVLDDGWQTASRGFFQYANSAYKQRDRERMDELAEESGSWAEWNEKFPSGGKAVADYIKSRGLTPGLWLCPFATDENELTEAHPEWWVRDEEGWIVPTFKARYTIDATNPEVLREWLKPTIRRMVEDWGFEYLKMDGMTHVTKAYKDHEARLYANRKEDVEDMGWVEAYREGHKAIREAAGQDTFTLSCWGTAWQGVGLTDSSRTGTDAGVGQSDIIDVRIERPFGA
ncbi:MAG: alpha-galactosidase, partial [Verrucomicrobiota bacterium]